jgi:hypothetical protein
MNELFPPQPVLAEADQSSADTVLCEHCKSPFAPRTGTGGKPQRFCSARCRQDFHVGKPQREQRGPTCSNVGQPPAVTPPEQKPPPAATLEDSEHFDWSEDESIILREQPSTAAYFNKFDELVIRQHRWPDDDQIIVIAPESIQEFLDKLTDVCGIPSVGGAEP